MAKSKRHNKVLKLEILKPADDMPWKELGKLLRDAQRRVYRLANFWISERYLDFHLYRTGRKETIETRKIGEVNRNLREMLEKEGVSEDDLNRFSRSGALPDSVCSAVSWYKIKGFTTGDKWKDVLSGKSSLPTFRSNMSIPIRCDKAGSRRLERMPNGDIEVDLMICVRPYPRVVFRTGKLNGGPREILERLLLNEDQSESGYRQRCFEVKYNERIKRWLLYVSFDFPAEDAHGLSKDKVVGVDLGYAVPAYVALNNGHARLGWNHFAGLAARVRTLQRQTMARRRNMQRGGKSDLSKDTARSGHGRNRKLQSIEQLRGRIDNGYTTLNDQVSRSIVEFAVDHGAGVIQMEDLKGFGKTLSGTFLGERWRFFQLQEKIDNKAKEYGIEVRKVKPQFTSRRCSKCGFIHNDFTREFRDKNRREGYLKQFECPECGFKTDPDYNAALNLACLDIEKLIQLQCEKQGIALRKNDD